jgi:hypothetical protein
MMTHKTHTQSPRLQLAGMLLVALAGGVALWIGSDWADGLRSAAIIAAFALVIHVGRTRSDALRAASGIGDERTRGLYIQANAVAAIVLAVACAGWAFVSTALGEPNDTLGIVALIYAVSFLGSCAVLARRS